MRFRHEVGFFLVVLLVIFVAGCTQQMVCNPPNEMIGNACCLDADADSVCDAQQEKETVSVPAPVKVDDFDDDEEQDAAEAAADTFASTWDRKSYTALHNLFVKDYRLKYSAQEFNFLARRVDASVGVLGVSLRRVDGDTAVYEVALPKGDVLVTADIDEEDGSYLHEAFYLFSNLTPDAACGTNGSCFLSYAVLSNDRNYCDKAGEFRAECVEKFGVSKSMSSKIDNCLEILEYYSRVECLDRLAVNENDIEPCWQATHDKQAFECMGKVAAARDDFKDCEEFIKSKGYSGTRLQHAYCIMGYVKETTDTKACAEIDRRGDVVLGAMQENCYKLNFP